MFLIDTLDNTREYMVSTLLKCLAEAASKEMPIPHSYRNIIRREKSGVKEYLTRRQDPVNKYRFYTGKLIHKILKYEIARLGK